jgi:hypothetical protein
MPGVAWFSRAYYQAVTKPERLWRVRRQGSSMDARLVERPAGGFEVQYFKDGTLFVTTDWPTRDGAVADANVRLKDLLVAGWATHW